MLDMLTIRRPPVATPPLQGATVAHTPTHTDPSYRIVSTTPQPVEHRGAIWQPPSPICARPSILQHPNLVIAPPTLIGDQTGDQSIMSKRTIHTESGMPAQTWALRRNFRATAPIEPGEAEV